MRYLRPVVFPLCFIALVVVGACSKYRSGFTPEVQPLTKPLTTYSPMEIPADNPLTAEKAALGRQLFFDERLSGDGTRSCYSCHVCEKGLTDGLPKAVGAFNKQLPRSSPTLWNIGYHKEFYWDGRSPSLEKQAMAAWTGANMGAKADEIVAKLNQIEGYRSQFQKTFGTNATADNVVKAIASYERTIITGDTPWDHWRATGGDESAMREDVKRGWKVFQEAKCNNCHDGVLFTDFQYHNVGIGMDQKEPDVGRFKVSNNAKDTGAFMTPTLRDIAKSAPYFHDGSIATLEEAVDFMLGGGRANQYLDKTNLQKHDLDKQQKADLIAFLKSLSVTDCKVTQPPLPQQ